MNASLLATLAQLTLGIAAFICLALAMEKYARHTSLRRHRHRQRHRIWFRWAGWSLLIFNLLIAVNTSGWGIGLVSLFGVLSVAALIVVMLITYRPRLLVATAAGSAATAVVLLGFILLG